MKCHRHENIVAYKESFFEGSCLYIAMEYCEGGTMFAYLKSKGAGLDEQEFIDFLKQILNGVKVTFSYWNGWELRCRILIIG